MNYNLGTYMPGWEIENLIGEGSFGKVYKIVRNNFGIEEHCALKIISIPQSKAELQSIRNDGMDDDSVTEYYRGLVEDFVQEIAMLSKLKGNQNIVSYEDYSVVPHEDGIGWDILIRMELLTALPTCFNNNSMSEKEVVKLAIDICNALEICHAQKIIHRDIKIDNIFISQNGNYKLGDFGVARNIEKTVSGLSKKGTYTYMAPEVYKGDAYNENVDLYSLGIVMYKLLNNNREPFLPPFPEVIKYSVKNEALVRRMRGETILPPQNASEAVGRIILKACEFNSNSRYQKPSEMKMDLMSVLKELENEQPQAQTEVLGFDEVDDEGTTLLDETSNEVEGTVVLDKDYAALEETMLLPEDEDEGTAILVEDDTEGTMVLDEVDFDFEETAVLNEDQQVEMITQLDGSIGYRHKEEAEEKELPEYYDKDYQTAVSKIENSESEQDYYDGIKIMQSLSEDKYLPAVEYLQNKDNLKKDFSKDGEQQTPADKDGSYKKRKRKKDKTVIPLVAVAIMLISSFCFDMSGFSGLWYIDIEFFDIYNILKVVLITIFGFWASKKENTKSRIILLFLFVMFGVIYWLHYVNYTSWAMLCDFYHFGNWGFGYQTNSDLVYFAAIIVLILLSNFCVKLKEMFSRKILIASLFLMIIVIMAVIIGYVIELRGFSYVEPKCEVNDCYEHEWLDGYCEKHYVVDEDDYDDTYVEDDYEDYYCSVPECLEEEYANGYCEKHNENPLYCVEYDCYDYQTDDSYYCEEHE